MDAIRYVRESFPEMQTIAIASAEVRSAAGELMSDVDFMAPDAGTGASLQERFDRLDLVVVPVSQQWEFAHGLMTGFRSGARYLFLYDGQPAGFYWTVARGPAIFRHLVLRHIGILLVIPGQAVLLVLAAPFFARAIASKCRGLLRKRAGF